MRLIDAENIKRTQLDLCDLGYDICFDVILLEDIESAPTIEAEPVRHGEWVHTDEAASWKSKDECGECRYHTADRVDLSCLNYCPNCGAKMDEKENVE